MAAAGRRRLRAAVGDSASTISVTLTRARGAARQFQIAVSFFRFSSADRAGAAAVGGAGRRWCRRRSSIAAELGGGCRRPPAPPRRRRGLRVNHSRHPHARARGARRRFQIAVSFFRFSSADRAGAAAVGGAGRRWCRRRSSIAAELGGGCRRPPAPPRRRRGLRVNHFRHPHARARRGAPIPDRGFIF